MMVFMRKWHRYLGIWTALLVLMLSITGILLVHKKELGLNKFTVRLPGGSSYAEAEPLQMLTIDNLAIVATKQGLYVRKNNAWLRTLTTGVRSMKHIDGRLYVASREGIFESGDNGEQWLQHLPAQDIRTFVYNDNQLMAASTTGIFIRSGNSGQWNRMGSEFKKTLDVRELVSNNGTLWLVAKEGVFSLIDGKLLKETTKLSIDKSEQVELQKIITDLHNGKIGGGILVTAIDLTAAGLIFLTVSGIWIWWVPHRKKQKKVVWT